jgi:hypothetical protein
MILDISQPYGLPRPATRIALPFQSNASNAIKEDGYTCKWPPFVIINVVSNHSEVAVMWTLLDSG